MLSIEINKTIVCINNPVYLGRSILEISKTPMYEFWYNYIELKFEEKAQILCMDANSF